MTHTFLPKTPPIKTYSDSPSVSLLRLEEIAGNLPKLLLTGKVQSLINSLNEDDLSVNELFIESRIKNIRLAMVHLSFISHAYIWGGIKPESSLPEVLAKPWVKVSKTLGRPPILSYASYCLDNWFKIDEDEEISLDNVALITNFLGGVDEDWFVTIHVCIEDAASDAIGAAQALAEMTDKNSEEEILDNLKTITKSLKKVNSIFSRMPEKCDPYIYYHRVRPFIFGTKDNPDLKQGLIYKGEYNDEPQFFRGETGAQSSIMPFLDGALGIYHTKDSLRHYLNEMREYMPPEHRAMIDKVEDISQALRLINQSKILVGEYNNCLEEIRAFRALHLEFAGTYINKQSQIKNPFGRGGSTITGTGGTPFMQYLKKHRDETEDQKIGSE
jgi:indoleamine 2,3-dioxygenase|tara:strand:- start:596 stop:1753 length:1158 start_codon:yes stop_codon:yes gene_type:complete